MRRYRSNGEQGSDAEYLGRGYTKLVRSVVAQLGKVHRKGARYQEALVAAFMLPPEKFSNRVRLVHIRGTWYFFSL
jgi:hypothetical protein